MAECHLLAAPDSLIDRIESVLADNAVPHRPKVESVLTVGKHTYDLTELQCQSGRAIVELGIEKRRGRKGADIVVMPSRRFIFWRHRESDQLAERLVRIFCENGADDSPDAKSELIG